MYLYIRMFLSMGVTLYTSRVVLNTLGIDDFGVYSIVGGVVTLFSFFNSAMSSATQRYLAFDIGADDSFKLRKTFNTVLIIHAIIALLIFLLAETIGLWYINNKLNVPIERIDAVNWVYQFSILTALIGVMQVPFNALIIAREKMNVFASMSIIEVSLKLMIVYLLYIVNYDKLIAYSVLIFTVSLVIAMCYRIYCYVYFEESKFKIYTDKAYYIELFSYSGWNLFGNIAAVAKGQGVNLVLNVFFGTMVNAAYGITLQIQSSVSVFVNNFQLAVNPQIIKNYSQGKLEQTNKLIFNSAKFSFFLMLLVITPILFNTNYVLILWLKTPPPFTVLFVQLCLLNALIDCISGPLMIGAQATGKIKWYQIIVGSLVFLNLPISYFILTETRIPSNVFVVSILISLISLAFRLFFLRKVLGFNVVLFFKSVISSILFVLSAVFIFFYAYIIYAKFPETLIQFLLHSLLIVSVVLILVYIIGLNKSEKIKISSFVKNFLRK